MEKKKPVEQEKTKVNVEHKNEELTFLCSVCKQVTGKASDGVVTQDGKTNYKGAKMWARPKKPGSDVQTVVVCAECKDQEILEAKEKGEKTPIFYPLAASLARDEQADKSKQRFEKRKARAEAKRKEMLSELYDEELRQPRQDIVCTQCGKHHGQVIFFKGDAGEGIVIIERAKVVYPEEPLGEVKILPMCRKCRWELVQQLGIGSSELPDKWYRQAKEEAVRENEKRRKMAAYAQSTPSRTKYEPTCPRGKGTIRGNSLKKTGTNGR